MHHWLRVAAASALLALASLALGGARDVQSANDAMVAYELSPEMQGDTITALNVTIRLRADASGTTTLDWADQWAGEARLGQWARDIQVEGAHSTSIAAHGGRIIRSAPGAPLVMRYRILSAYAADPTADNSAQASPVVRPGWFYALGEVLYVRPLGREHAPARFAWTGPAGIGFASDTEHATGFDGHPRSVGDMLDSIAIGGRDLSVSTVTLNGAPVRIAHIGRFRFSGAAFASLATRVISIERDFWRDTKAGPFLITAIPLSPSPTQLNYSGIGRSDAFATWIDAGASLPDVAWLLSHEYFHSWNARQLGRFPVGADTQAYWMSEGFTDFYARRLMLRGALWAPTQFADDWNAMLHDYAASPFRTASNADAAAKFWSGDYAAGQIAYQRGAMLAALWDWRLRAKGGGSLDAVMLAQRDRTLAAKQMPLLIDALIAEMARAGLDIRPDIERYLVRGDPIELPEDLFGSCARLVSSDLPVFELGWDSEATAKAGGVITGIDPQSNAYAGGLRNGMRIVRRFSGEDGNPSLTYGVEVRGGASPFYNFLPAGRKAGLRQQQIVLDPARIDANPDKCRMEMAG